MPRRSKIEARASWAAGAALFLLPLLFFGEQPFLDKGKEPLAVLGQDGAHAVAGDAGVAADHPCAVTPAALVLKVVDFHDGGLLQTSLSGKMIDGCGSFSW